MHEKDTFLQTWDREFATTMKVLKQLPADKADFKPTAEKTKSAKELANVFIAELSVMDHVVKGVLDFGSHAGSKSPATYDQVLSTFESTQKAMVEKVKNMPDADWNSTMQFPVGPGKMGEVRRGDLFWMMLMDSIHHRGQFSIYLRLVGAKVPSIYGGSADEPWF